MARTHGKRSPCAAASASAKASSQQRRLTAIERQVADRRAAESLDAAFFKDGGRRDARAMNGSNPPPSW
jgi:hypothetical protein